MAEGRSEVPPLRSAGIRRSFAVTGLGAGACIALLASIARPPSPLLVWNASASSPTGLYLVRPGVPRPGSIAIAWPPRDVRVLADRRDYLPAGVPLVKHVAAGAGSFVCATADQVTVDGHPLAIRKPADRARRPLPWWRGCRLLGPGDLFLLSPIGADSFDGRYFGPTRVGEVIGEGLLLWRR